MNSNLFVSALETPDQAVAVSSSILAISELKQGIGYPREWDLTKKKRRHKAASVDVISVAKSYSQNAFISSVSDKPRSYPHFNKGAIHFGSTILSTLVTPGRRPTTFSFTFVPPD